MSVPNFDEWRAATFAARVAPEWRPTLPWICLDLETGNPPEDEIQAEIAAWRPPANLKRVETVEQARAEAAEKIREKAGLLDGAPVVSVALAFPLGLEIGTTILHTLRPVGVEGSFNQPTEKDLLTTLRLWLDYWAGLETALIGHNVLGFDLPKLRLRFAVHGLRLPWILTPSPDIRVDDTMRIFARYFLIGDRQFVSLDEMTRRLGVGAPKAMSGADVPRLAASDDANDHARVVQYNADDARMTAAAWQRLTSQIGD